MSDKSSSLTQRQRCASRADAVRDEMLAAQLYYVEGWPVSKLKEHPVFQTKSKSTIARIVHRARRYVDVALRGPEDKRLAAQLCATYQLVDAVVVEAGDESHVADVLGRAAADYFQNHVHDGAKVALSCGVTLSRMVQDLPRRLNLVLEIVPLSIEGDPRSIEHAPATLVGTLKAKVHPQSSAFGVQLLPGRDAAGIHYREYVQNSSLFLRACRTIKAIDWAFLGIGPGRSYVQDGLTIEPSFVKLMDGATGGEYSKRLERLDVVAELNNEPFDRTGRCVLPTLLKDVGAKDAVPIINLCTLDDLRKLASDSESHRIVGIAGGTSKVQAIRAALRLGFLNRLITDRCTAESILAHEGDTSSSDSIAQHSRLHRAAGSSSHVRKETSGDATSGNQTKTRARKSPRQR